MNTADTQYNLEVGGFCLAGGVFDFKRIWRVRDVEFGGCQVRSLRNEESCRHSPRLTPARLTGHRR